MELCKYKPPSGGNEVLVAVKRLLPSILKNKEELLAFVEETKLLRKLRHKYCPAELDAATFEPLQKPFRARLLPREMCTLGTMISV